MVSVISDINVDLPAPFYPNIPKICEFRSLPLMFYKAWRPYDTNWCEIFFISMVLHNCLSIDRLL